MPIRSDGEETRSRILSAAVEIFARKGFRGATNQEIAARAQANGASISYYFRDKAGLYRAVWEESQNRSSGIYASWLDGDIEKDLPGERLSSEESMERLIRVMKSIYDWSADPESCDSNILFDEMFESTGILSSFEKDIVLFPLMSEMQRLIGLLTGSSGETENHALLLSHVYLSSVRGFCGRNAPDWGKLPESGIFAQLLDLVLMGVKSRMEETPVNGGCEASVSYGKKAKPEIQSPQMELGVTDEVVFELKHPTREEIVFHEERLKAKMAEKEQEEKLEEEEPGASVSNEEQMELF